MARLACVQMRSGRDPAANVEAACRLVREAAAAGATYVQTPEMTNLLERDREALFSKIVAEEQDASLAAFRALAAELSIHLHVGSLAIRLGPGEAANRSFLIGPDGAVIASYDKIHMFDVEIGANEAYAESRTYRAGSRAVLADTALGRLGLTICYDLRFPALFAALARAGAQVIAVPSAFTRPTGEAHWETLLRARAIEAGAYIVAAAQGGRHESGRETWGRSMIVGPWGEVLAQAEGDEPGVIGAEIDLAAVAEARRRIPSLEHAREFGLDVVEAARSERRVS